MFAVWRWFHLDIVVSWESSSKIIAAMMTKRLDVITVRQWGLDSGHEVDAEVMS
jgi:hypothetical protein